ncbi:transmembrane protein 201 isoform X2 [Bombina bombina]|uniref:transmembrane protein 201 isoform X2 n=1 Tax=Bombina bombina TaxID=8345 RepID=UPI00235A9E0F|nr:transmembrane protein 201 isoform X2 [Bombina bombina]
MEGVRSVGPLAGLAAATGVTGLVLYRLLRRKRPTHVQVNCWFCNQNTVVPYGNRNCWDCPTCEQYNGFQENGDYNKPIPAQHSEHLNHGVFGGSSFGEVAKPQQWVNCQMLLCKKCNNNQTTKIKQMSSFIPREEDQYDEEIEVYKHHLEQMYKLCRPCQAAVDYYIKHQNRQLRAIMLDYHLKKREADKYQVQSFGVSLPTRAPLKVILLRFLAFLNCAFLLALALWGSGDLISRSHKDSLTTTSTENQHQNLSQNEQDKAGHRLFWEGVLDAVPEQTLENLNMAWRYGWSHQLIVVILGLLACIFAMILAGRIRLRRVDAFSSFLWVLVTCLYLTEQYLLTDAPTWMDTAKLGTISLCCLFGFTAAIATRKATSQRRPRPRRFTSGNTVSTFGSVVSTGGSGLSSFPSPLLSTPPGLLQLVNQQMYQSQRKSSPSSLPGRLSRALSLGTIPSLSRTDSGYLFSGSRPPSLSSVRKDSPGSDYFSLLSGSCASSPLPSPTPSVAGSAVSSSGSLYHRRPLISPARLNLHGKNLCLSSTLSDGTQTQNSFEDSSHPDSSTCQLDIPHCLTKTHKELMTEMRSVSSKTTRQKEDSSSHSSACQVHSTSAFLDHPPYRGISLLHTFLLLSLTVNILFVTIYLYPSLY